MRKACLFFDIDGTLVDEVTHRVPDSAHQALKLAQENGHHLFLNTGRPFSLITPYLKSLKFDGYCCGCGTEVIVDEKTLFSFKLDADLCQQIVDKITMCKIDAVLEGTPSFYKLENVGLPAFCECLAGVKKEGFQDPLSWQNDGQCFQKFVVFFDQDSDFESFHQFVTANNLEYMARGEGFGEIVPSQYSKATSIEFIRNLYQMNLEDCYAFGDSTNDISMLQHVQHSVAMKNGNPILFDQVEFVTESVDQHGIELALRHFQLI